MTDIETAKEHKTKVYQRLTEAREMDTSALSAAERRSHVERIRILKGMYEDACAEVRRLEHHDTIINNNKKTSRVLDVTAACGAVWSDIEGVTWNSIEGYTWSQLSNESTGRHIKNIRDLIRVGMSRCTEQQLLYVNEYYADGLTLEEIGEKHGVDTSTVSRTLKRARRRIGDYISAKLLISTCIDHEGLFDYQLFLNSTHILTERQKEIVFLSLMTDTRSIDIATFIQRRESTVSRTITTSEYKLSILSVDLDQTLSVKGIRRNHLNKLSEKQLAEDMGLLPSFYYRVVCQGQEINGIPLHHCAIMHRLARGESSTYIAKTFGCSKPLVSRIQNRYKNIPLPDFTEDYHPKEPRVVKLPDNPFVMLSRENAIIDSISAETYQKILERFGD